MDELSASQPVLAIPVDRGRLATRTISAAHRGDHLAGPPPRDVNRRPTGAPDGSTARAACPAADGSEHGDPRDGTCSLRRPMCRRRLAAHGAAMIGRTRLLLASAAALTLP